MNLPSLQPNYRNPASLKPSGIRFGHTAKPQPENTQEWLSDFFFPRKETPCNDSACTEHDHENSALKDKNMVEKVCLWFKELADGFRKDVQVIFKYFTQKSSQSTESSSKKQSA
jgi:hypothetical protein